MLGYAAALVVPFQYGFVVATIIPVAALIGATAQADVEGRHTFLRSRPMVWLGEVSFGFYLVQGVAIFYLRSLLGEHTYSVPVALLAIAGFFCTPLLDGWVLLRFVEVPAMRRFGRSRPRTPQVPQVVAAPHESPVPVAATTACRTS